MPENIAQAAASTESSKVNNDNQAQSQKNATDSLKDQCNDYLKSSCSKKDGKLEFNQKAAIEKLELSKELITNTELRLKVDNLVDQIKQTDPQRISSLQQLQELVEQAFQKPVSLQMGDQDLAVNISFQAAENPFKVNNPFAPKIIEKMNKTSETNWQKDRTASTEAEASSFDSKTNFLL